MRYRSLCMTILVGLLLVITCLPGHAWRRHGGNVWIVGPGWAPYPPYPYPYPYTYYYAPPPRVIIEQQPEVYIQRDAPAPVQEQSYWYYCPSPQGYYPYIKECSSSWIKVAPTPPDRQQTTPPYRQDQP